MKLNFLMLFTLFAMVLNSCAGQKHQIQTYENPTIVQFKYYQVIKGDCLWSIAAKKEIYNDAFQWPLIFKMNRDTVANQDLIYPNQNLIINTGFSDSDIQLARQIASNTPAYKHQ
jgi:hypothetical protein